MTETYYQIFDDKGHNTQVVKTLPEAKAIVSKEGGNYKICYSEQLSVHEAFCRRNARTGGSQT